MHFCFFFFTFYLNTLISKTIYKIYVQENAWANDEYGACERCVWYVRTMDVHNENEWISVIACASINSAVLPSTEALSSVSVS